MATGASMARAAIDGARLFSNGLLLVARTDSGGGEELGERADRVREAIRWLGKQGFEPCIPLIELGFWMFSP